MTRPIRIEYEGAVYHVTARGNERRAIFRDDEDRQEYLETLAECVERFTLLVHIYCLMPNHYHLVVETPRANLSKALGWLQTTYSVRFNRRHGRVGHLFQGRFKAHLVEADSYATRLQMYVHLNPVRPPRKDAIIPRDQRGKLRAYRWSSHRAYLGLSETPDWLSLSWLSYWGRQRATAQQRYGQEIAEWFGKQVSNPFLELRDGLVLGGDVLWQRVQDLLSSSTGQEELKWKHRASERTIKRRLASLLKDEKDKRMQIWIRVQLGGERMTDLARELGYKDGSGIHRVVKRLEIQSKDDKPLARRMAGLRREMQQHQV